MNPTTSTQSSVSNTSERLRSSVENRFELSQNYYQRLNTEYRMALLTGNLNADSIREIESRTRPEDFERTFTDRFSAQAMQWRATKLFHRISNSWLGRMLGLQAALRGVQERVMGTLTSPFHTVRDAVGQIRTLPGLSTLDFSSPEALNRSQTVLGRLGRKGQLASDMLKLQAYLEQNPQVSANASEEDLTSEQFWNTVLDRADITENRTEIIQIVTGQKTAQEVFENLESTENSDPNTPETSAAESLTSESEATSEEVPEGMIRLSELKDRTIQNTRNLGERVMIQFRLLENNSQVFTYTAAGIFLRNYGTNLVSMAGSTASSMANASVKLFQIARMTTGATIRTATSNPLMFSTAMFGGAALALYLADNVETDPYVPENPRVASRMIYERLQNNPQWQEMTSKEPFSNLSPEQIQEAIENSLDPERFNSYIRSIPFEDVTNTMINFLSLTEHEVINQANNVGFNNLQLNIQNALIGIDSEQKEEILTQLSRFELSFVNNSVSENLLQELAEFLEQEPLSIKLIISDDGKRIQWYQMLEGQQIGEIQNLMINPSLSHEEQLRVARSFTATSSLLSSPDIFLRGNRESLNRLKERMSGLKERIENGEYSLFVLDGVAYIASDTATILRAPLDMFSSAWSAIMEGSLSMALNEFAAITAQGIIPMLVINIARMPYDQGTIIQRMRNVIGRTALWPLDVGRQQFYLARNLATEMGRANLKARFNEMLHTNTLNRAFHAARGTSGNIQSARRLRTFVELHVELSRTVDTFGSSRAGQVANWGNTPVSPAQRTRILQLLSDLNPNQQIGHLQSNLATYADLRQLRDTVTGPEFRRLQNGGLLRTELNPRLFGDSNNPRQTDTTRPADADSTRPANADTTTRPADAEAPRATQTSTPRGRARRYAGRSGAILGMLGLGAAAYKIGDHLQRDTAVRYDYQTQPETSIPLETNPALNDTPTIEVASENTTEDTLEILPTATIQQKISAENERLLTEYSEIINYFKASNLEEVSNQSESQLSRKFQELLVIHRQQTEKLKNFVSTNRNELTQLLQSENIDEIAIGIIDSEDFIYENRLEQNFALGKVRIDSETNRLFLEHMSPDEFNRMFWDMVNTAKGSVGDQLIDLTGIESSRSTEVAAGVTTFVGYMAPGIGTGLDFRDAIREARRGNMGEAAMSTIFGTLGLGSDILLGASILATPVTLGGSAAAGAAVTTGFRATLAAARASRAARVLRANRGLITGTSVGIGGASITTSSALGVFGKRPYSYESRAYFN